MSAKDGVVVHDASMSVEFVPIPGSNQPQQQTPNLILASLGGSYVPLKDGDEVRPLEGYVPPSNRNGDTAGDDPSLGRHKAYVLRNVDTTVENGEFPNLLDPRDNPHAPDKWDTPVAKEVAPKK